MRAISRFLRTTIFGGVLFLMPVVVLGLILGKAFDIARRGLKPIVAMIPDRSAYGVPTETVMVIVVIAALCFLAGLLARSTSAQAMIAQLENSVLSKLPVYEYLKQTSANVMGLDEMTKHPVVLAQLGGAWRIGLQTDVAEGGLVAVFIPNSPNAFSGSVFYVTSDKVRLSDQPLAAAIGCLRRCGVRSGAVVSRLAAGAAT
jgi:uncharacterized membrane protein